MKTLNDYINESLLFEAYDAVDVCKKIQSIEGFNTKIKASNSPDKLYLLKFNKTTGDVIDEKTCNNDINNEYVKEFNCCVNCDYCIDNNNKEYISWLMAPGWNDCSLSVDIVENTKKRGIIIGYFDKANTEIIKQFVKDNLKLFDTSSDGLTKNEIDELDKFFSSIVKNYEKKLNKKTFAAYFPSQEDAKKLSKVGLSNIPHITISRPPSYKGNLKVTSYRAGNWQGTEWPDVRKIMNSDGSPKYSNIDSIISYLEKIIVKNGDKLGVELKIKNN